MMTKDPVVIFGLLALVLVALSLFVAYDDKKKMKTFVSKSSFIGKAKPSNKDLCARKR